MTARDEAISIVTKALPLSPRWFAQDHAENAIDSIPPDVLARLAIERGGLKRYVTASSDPDTPPLFRLVGVVTTVSAAGSTKADGAPSP